MKWFERLAAFLEKRGRYRLIDRILPDGTSEKYLERWYIVRTKYFGLYLHRFWASDEDPVHDHPWNNFSWIINSGYWEYLPDGQRLWRTKGFKTFRTAEQFHRIELQPNTRGQVWTIFGRFRRRRKWGFWHVSGWQEAEYQGGE